MMLMHTLGPKSVCISLCSIILRNGALEVKTSGTMRNIYCKEWYKVVVGIVQIKECESLERMSHDLVGQRRIE